MTGEQLFEKTWDDTRAAANVKPVRAELSTTEVREYFENLESELDGVPPEDICNFDSTNFAKDSGMKKVVCERGQKRVGRVINFSRESTSVMCGGFADGSVLPMFVVYKGCTSLYENWTAGGPPGMYIHSVDYNDCGYRSSEEYTKLCL